jgi:hypothetical protein
MRRLRFAQFFMLGRAMRARTLLLFEIVKILFVGVATRQAAQNRRLQIAQFFTLGRAMRARTLLLLEIVSN